MTERLRDNHRPYRALLQGNILALGIVSFFTDVSSEMIYPLLPVFFTGLATTGAAPLYLGLMESVAEATASLLKIAAGHLSDRLRLRKAIALAGYGLSTAVRPAMALATAPWHPVLLRFADRMGKGLRTAPRDALLSDSVDPSIRGLAFSFHRAMDHAGAVVGPLAAIGILYAFLGRGLWQGGTDQATSAEMAALRWVFAIALLPGLLAVAALATRVREIRPGGERGSAEAPAMARPDARLPWRFYGFLGTVVLFTLGNSSDLFLVLYGKTAFGLGLLQIVALWVLLHLSKIAFSFPGGLLSDRLGRRVAISAGWVVYALVYVGMGFVEAEWHLWALLAVYGAYYGLTEGAEKALVADIVPSEQRGRAFGLYHGAVGLAALPASLVFGLLWVELGPRVAFWSGAALAAAATAALLAITPRRGSGAPV